MHVSFYIIVRNSFLMNAWWSCARDYPGYPGQSAQYDGHGGGQHDVSQNALLSSLLKINQIINKIKNYQ